MPSIGIHSQSYCTVLCTIHSAYIGFIYEKCCMHSIHAYCSNLTLETPDPRPAGRPQAADSSIVICLMQHGIMRSGTYHRTTNFPSSTYLYLYYVVKHITCPVPLPTKKESRNADTRYTNSKFEQENARGRLRNTKLHCSVIDVRPILVRELFSFLGVISERVL
jgi:hypothetical protein